MDGDGDSLRGIAEYGLRVEATRHLRLTRGANGVPLIREPHLQVHGASLVTPNSGEYNSGDGPHDSSGVVSRFVESWREEGIGARGGTKELAEWPAS